MLDAFRIVDSSSNAMLQKGTINKFVYGPFFSFEFVVIKMSAELCLIFFFYCTQNLLMKQFLSQKICK